MVNKKQVSIGAGAVAAAAAAAAAGYYFYASKDAKQHRKVAAKWAGGLKREVIREAKKLKTVDRAKIAAAIDTAVSAYENVRSVDSKELVRAAKELKNNWREVVAEVGVGTAKRATKRVVKRAVKKAAKRAR